MGCRVAVAAAALSIALGGCGSGGPTPTVQQQSLDSGRRVFVKAGCGGCHTLAEAGTHGTVGPNFDTSEQLSAAQIREQLVIGAGGMPSFRTRLSPRERAQVARFLAAVMSRRPR